MQKTYYCCCHVLACSNLQVSSHRRAQGVQPSLSQTGIWRQLPGNSRCQSCSSAVPVRHRLLPAHGRVHAAMDAWLQGMSLAAVATAYTHYAHCEHVRQSILSLTCQLHVMSVVVLAASHCHYTYGATGAIHQCINAFRSCPTPLYESGSSGSQPLHVYPLFIPTLHMHQ